MSWTSAVRARFTIEESSSAFRSTVAVSTRVVKILSMSTLSSASWAVASRIWGLSRVAFSSS